MPTRKRATKSSPEVTSQSTPTSSRFAKLGFIKKVPMPRTWTPVLMILLLVATFLIGVLITKVQYLEGNGGSGSGSTYGTQQAGAGAPTAAPGQKVENVVAGNFPALGNKDAKVKIIEYADFQCPFCEQWYTTVESSLMKDYVNSGKVAFYFNNYPFLGQESNWSAEAAYCANEQGKFWDYHNYLYEHQGQENSGAFSKDNLKGFAAAMGLDTAKFNDCLDNDKYSKDVANDLADGQKAGVSGTPTVFINGVPIVGAQPYDQFKQAVDAAIAGK